MESTIREIRASKEWSAILGGCELIISSYGTRLSSISRDGTLRDEWGTTSLKDPRIVRAYVDTDGTMKELLKVTDGRGETIFFDQHLNDVRAYRTLYDAWMFEYRRQAPKAINWKIEYDSSQRRGGFYRELNNSYHIPAYS